MITAIRGGLRLALVAAMAAFALCAPAYAQLRVNVEQGYLNPMPIAVPDFSGTDATAAQIGSDVAGVIRDNLDRSGLFNTLDPASFIQRLNGVDVPVQFADWRALRAQALIVGEAQMLPDGRVRVEFRLWDVLGEQDLIGFHYATTPENWRRIAHRISDLAYERLTGEPGYFDTRVVFVSESGPAGAGRSRRLMVMDQDGANPAFLTPGGFQAFTPRFSPTMQAITFLSLESDRPRVYLFNLETNRRELLVDGSAMTFAPRFSPDGQSVVYAQDFEGNIEIMRMDLRTRRAQRLTAHPAIDTSASFSPDGSQIAFASDRSGSSQIYVMGADGTNPRRLTFTEGARYDAPVWSPRGDWVAMIRQGRANSSGEPFQLVVMRADGSGERNIAGAYLSDSPTWSPNGRVIMFARESRGGASQLWSIDITGRNLRQVRTQTSASDPAWSPLLP
ncbi:MAG: Tol-Pal system beta propeller repeat protein TolB [Caulobacterales bacterium]